MKRKLRGLKRTDIQLDFDLYRVPVPIPGVAGDELSVVDIHPPGVNRTMVFIHGYAGCAETWEHQINHFSREFRVVAPDLRGHGQSDAPFTRYTMRELVADLFAISQHLELPEQFVLVGHSFGGSICVEYANVHPEQIERLVLIATAGEYPLRRTASLAYHIPTAMLQPLWSYRPRWNAELHVMKRMAVNNMTQWQGWSLMRAIQVPTLVITGERDTYFPRYAFVDVGRIIPGAEVVDVGASKHKVQLERHQAVNRAIERFVEDTERRATWREVEKPPDSEAGRPWLKLYSKGTPPTVPIPRRPLHEFLESAAEALPRRAATVFYGQRLTYARLNQLANQIGQILHGLGVQPGDRVMILLPNMPEHVAAFFGILKIGGVAVLPHADATAADVARQAQETGAIALITLHALDDLAGELRNQSDVRDVLLVDLTRDAAGAEHAMVQRLWPPAETQAPEASQPASISPGRSLRELLRDAPFDAPRTEVSSDDAAAIVYTSGVTGPARGVRLSHANLAANTLQVRHWIPDLRYGEETFLTVLPLCHAYGMTMAMTLPIAVGATMLLLPQSDLTEILHNIFSFKPTFFPGTPDMFAAITRAPNIRSYGLSSIRACISGAAPLPVEVQEAFEKLTQARLMEGYGLTEASPVTHANPPDRGDRSGSIGVPLPNTDARVVDRHTGEELPPGAVGELLVKGPQVMMGYADNGADVDADGWLATGDLVIMDPDGFFQFIGRTGDVIEKNGHEIYPRDVEEVLYEHSRVQEAAVVGVPGAAGSQRVKAFVVLRTGTTLSVEELCEHCRRRLDDDAVPDEIEFRTDLPRTALGQVLTQALGSQG
ncbi:MAG: alpha/beta fold hydrolase [Anaerolineae bacterium]|nr:alpha/beta fold hydrolase [Anaerolineae bacterium]